MKFNVAAIAVAGVCAALGGTAMAEDAYHGSWYAVPGIGIMHTDSDLKADNNNFAYGLHLGKEISEHWDVQPGLTHAPRPT